MRRYAFADEAGDFAFKKNDRASRFYIICTVAMDGCEAGDRLLRLRRELVWDGLPLSQTLHACEDKQQVRDRVFSALAQEDFTVQATILEKSKAQPQTRTSNAKFYKYGWYFHLSGTYWKLSGDATELLLTAASIAQKKQQVAFSAAVRDVAGQCYGARVQWKTFHPPSATDPCLQIADYCTWAIQRKWEKGDCRSYDLIKNKINHECESWKRGTTHYY